MGEALDDSHEESEHADPEAKNRNKLAKELLEIRNRRSGNVQRNFFTNKENFVLAAGVLYTILCSIACWYDIWNIR